MIKIFFAVLKRVGEVLDMEELESDGFKDSITDMSEDTRVHIVNASFTVSALISIIADGELVPFIVKFSRAITEFIRKSL